MLNIRRLTMLSTVTDGVIDDIIVGDTKTIYLAVDDVSSGDAIVKAWFTAKGDLAHEDPGVLQLDITTSESAKGQVLQNGASDGRAILKFNFATTDTQKLKIKPELDYDFQVMTASSKLHSLELGVLRAKTGVTSAIS